MDIEKIKNYNQKMLAVIVTTAVAFAIIGLFAFIVFLFTEVFNFSRSSTTYNQEGLQVEEVKQKTSEENLYNLQVSYNFPDLVDTISQLYIISVSHQTTYELQNNLIKRGKYSSSIRSSDSYDYYSQSTYINLLAYDSKNAKLEKLFTQKILIGQYNNYYYPDDVLLVFEAVTKDSNKDGQLSLDDETSLYFYSMRNKSMKQAKLEGQTVLQYAFIPKTKNAIIHFGKNPYENRKKDEENVISPGILCQYNYGSDNLAKINDNQLDTEIKTIAEGKK